MVGTTILNNMLIINDSDEENCETESNKYEKTIGAFDSASSHWKYLGILLRCVFICAVVLSSMIFFWQGNNFHLGRIYQFKTDLEVIHIK